jgi:ABC-type branched-subunit amino acid transport system substrate-binding protein
MAGLVDWEGTHVKPRRTRLSARRARVASLAVIAAVVISASACSSGSASNSSAAGGTGSATAGSGAASSTATKSPIDVGLVTSLTSTSLAPYPQVATAQKAAIAYINSVGGINGHPLVANQCDDQDQANVAAACAAAAVR